MYGSEIWGPNLIRAQEGNTTAFISSIEKLQCEKLHISYCRSILRVHKKSQNSAVRGELGRVPLGNEIVTNILKYHQHLKSKDTTSILGEALLTNENLKKTRSRHWSQRFTKIQQYCQAGQPSQNLYNRHRVRKFLDQGYILAWQTKIANEPKMRTYKLFKQNLQMEDYLSVKNEQHRSAMTKLRISAHSLAIERGRYNRPPTPVSDRTCSHCPGAQVEDELHFLTECDRYITKRNELYKKISDKCHLFSTLSNQNKLVYMLSAGYDVAVLVAEFIFCNLPP